MLVSDSYNKPLNYTAKVLNNKQTNKPKNLNCSRVEIWEYQKNKLNNNNQRLSKGKTLKIVVG